jgi:hypothetical protein
MNHPPSLRRPQSIVNGLVDVSRSDTGGALFARDTCELNKIARPAARSAQPKDLVLLKLGRENVLNAEFV